MSGHPLDKKGLTQFQSVAAILILAAGYFGIGLLIGYLIWGQV